jgi:hypothetical protein
MSAVAEGEVAREARRVFRKLGSPGSHLRRRESGDFRIVAHGEGDGCAPVAAALVDAFVRRGWLTGIGASHFVLTEAGAGWYARVTAEEAPFAAQHQVLTRRLVADKNGVEQVVTVNEAESPLSQLRRRRLIDAAQFEAGEKLRRDFTLAQLMPRLGVDLTAPVVVGRRGQGPDHTLSDTVIAAKQRFNNAMHAAGPGLSDLLFDVCCHLRGLPESERAKGWPRRSARIVLILALERLVVHYGLRVRGCARMRVWQFEDVGEKTGA